MIPYIRACCHLFLDFFHCLIVLTTQEENCIGGQWAGLIVLRFCISLTRKKIFALVAMVLIVEIFVIDSLVLLHSWIVWLHLVSPAAIVWLHLLSNFHKFKFWQECMAATYVSTKLLNSSFSICYFKVID